MGHFWPNSVSSGNSFNVTASYPSRISFVVFLPALAILSKSILIPDCLQAINMETAATTAIPLGEVSFFSYACI